MAGKVLVTGGTGYIGSHTVVELQNVGFDVIIIDNLSNSHIDVLDGIEKITGTRPVFQQFDLCDREKTINFFNSYSDIKCVVHFAAFKAVGESVTNPVKYYHNNLTSLANLLFGMTACRVPNIVFSSSCTVYGQPDRLPVNEDAPVKKANSPYGNTKQISEEIILDTIHASKILKAISLRYFNPIGAHPSAHIGELPLGVPDNLVPYITQTAAGVRDYLRVFGNDYNTPDGFCIRDYIDIVDLAEAHVVAVKRLLGKQSANAFEVFNLGTGNGMSVMEVIRAFEKATGQKLNYKIVDRRPGDVEQVWAYTGKANRELGWKAKRTLEETLLSAWNWEKKYRHI